MSEAEAIHLKNDLLDLALDQSDEDTGPVDEDAYNRTRMLIAKLSRQKPETYSRGDAQAGDALQDNLLPLLRQQLWPGMNLNYLPRLLEQQARGYLIYQGEDGSLLVGDHIELEDDELHYEAGPDPWVKGTSKTGSTVWTNTITGERRYQESKPQARSAEEDEEIAKRRQTQQSEKQRQREEEKRRLEAEEAELLKRPPQVDRVLPGTQELIDQFFPGRNYTPEDIVKLVGALPGSEVIMSADTKRWGKNAGSKTLSISVYGPQYDQCSRELFIDSDGNLVMQNAMFFLKKKYRGSGMGMAQLSAQIQNCIDAGVDRIETCAGRGGIMNGYYTWPRLGYDRNLLEIHKEGWRWNPANKFPGKKTVLDLMETPEGRAWWKKYGTTASMTFDLRPGSRSVSTMNNYLEERGHETRIRQAQGEVPEALKRHRKAARQGIPSNERPIPSEQYKAQVSQHKKEIWPKWSAHAALIGLSPEEIYSRASQMAGESSRKMTPQGVLEHKKELDRNRWVVVNDMLHERISSWVKSPEMADIREQFRPEIEASGLTWEGGLAYAAGSLVPHTDPREAVKAAFESVLNPEVRQELKRQTYHLPRAQVIGTLDDHNEGIVEQYGEEIREMGFSPYQVISKAADIAAERGQAIDRPTEHRIQLHIAAVDSILPELLEQIRQTGQIPEKQEAVTAQRQAQAEHYEAWEPWTITSGVNRGRQAYKHRKTGRVINRLEQK